MRRLFLLICLLTAFCSSGQVIPNYVPTDSLVGWWPFSGNANDISGNGHNGTNSGATLTSDRFNTPNNAYHFVGRDQSGNSKITIPHASVFNDTAFTISLWFKKDNSTIPSTPNLLLDGEWLISKCPYVGGGQNVRQFEISIDNNVQNTLTEPFWIVSGVSDNSNSAMYKVRSDSIFSGNWYFIVITKSYNNLKLYVNGIKEVDSLINDSFYTNTSDFLIGQYWGYTVPTGTITRDFTGTIDDVGMWNRVLTDCEIKNLYNASTGSCVVINSSDTTICSGDSVTLSTITTYPCSYLPQNLRTGMKAWYPFCGSGQDEVLDNDIISTISLTADRNGKPLSAANIQSSYLELPHKSYHDNDDITFAFWVYNGNTSGRRSYLKKGIYSNAAMEDYYFGIDNNNKFISGFKGNNSCIAAQGWSTNLSSSSFDNTSNWTHLVFSHVDDTVRIYRNGSEEVKYYLNEPHGFCGAAPLFFGTEWSSYPTLAGGVIDDIGIWNRLLTPSEISQLYNFSIENSFASILWSTGDTTSTINVSPSTTTKYWVRQIAGTDTIVDTITVNVLNPTINASTNSICNPGDSVMLWTSKDSSVTQSCGGIPASLQNGLMAYYPFCGNANDLSGFGNHGTVLNAALANDRNGNAQSAYYFDGSSKITVPSGAQISDSLNTQVTFSAWINVESYPYTFGPILSKNGPSSRQFEIWIDPNTLGFWGTQFNGSTNYSVPDSTWLHYVVTFDQGTVKYYINSTLVQTSTYTSTSLVGNNSVFEIGHDSPGSLELFNGYIDDVAIWNRVLSPTDVANLYNHSTNYSNTLWSTGETTDTIWINPTTDTTIWVSSTLGNVTCVDSIDIEVNNCLTITESDTTICLGDTLSLSANLNLQAGCLMNISYTGIPPGDPIPGFTYGGLYNGHYYYVYDTPTSWTQGEQLCRQNGGYLVCIDDINENTFVSNLVPSFSNKNIWIGLYRDSTTCQFRWLNCINIAYTNWRPGEPNSGPCGEPYAQIIRGCSFGLNTWNNLGNNASNGSCYSNMVPILEIDPTIGSTASTSILWSTGDTTNTINVSPTSTTKYWVRKTIDSDTIIDTITVHVLDPTINASSTTVCSASDSVMLWINADSTSTPSVCGDLPSGLNSGLVAWYPFCGNANDESSIGNNGTIYGATLTTDRNGNPNSAYEFNGNDWIQAPHNSSINFSLSDYYTISCWVNVDSNTTGSIYEKWNSSNLPYPYVLRVNDSLSKIHIGRYIGGLPQNQTKNQAVQAIGLNGGTFQNITSVFTPDTIYIYLNGIQLASQTNLMISGGDISNNDPLFIGRRGNQLLSFFEGIIDDFGIWNRALTQSEITQLYNGANSSSTLWSTGETTDTIWINPNSDTTIWVSSTLGNVTCVDSIDIEFLNPEIQSNTLGVCAPGDTAMLWVENESHSVTWSTGETSDTIFVNPFAATSYWVQFTSFNGVCSDTIEIDVSEPIAIFGDSLLCKGDSVLLYVDASSFFSLSDTLYFNDFENIVGNEFSATTTTTFSSSSLLGNFGDQTITLSLSSLPLDSIRLSFDLWIHDSWDGNQSGVIYQSDFWSLRYNLDTLINTTFSNWPSYNQSYPDNYPSSHLYQTGAISTAASLCSSQGSSKYHLSFDINNISTNGIISFDGTPSQSLCDESWSIDNVLIEALNGVQTSSVLWSTGHTSDSIWVKPTQTTTYWVSSTDQYGCESTDSIIVFVSDIQSTISVQEPSCNGSSDGQAQINPTGGIMPYTFLWSNGSGSNMANNLSSDTAWVAVTDSIGCSAVDTFFIDQPDSLIISNIQTSNYNGFNVSCNGGSDGNVSTTVIGGTMPYYYNWNNNTYTTSGISNVAAGTYVLQVTDTNGCTVNETILLSEPNPIIISPSITSNYNGYAISCYGESDGSADVTISGGIAPYSILWSNGVPTSSITNVPSGSYSVMITDDNGCVDSAQINLNQPNPLTGTASVTDASCYGNADGSLDLTLSGGAGSYFITWSTGDTSLSVYNLPSGWYTYSVISSNNCEIADSVYINQPTPLTIELDTVHPTCINSFDGELNVVAMGGTPGYNYFLNGNAFTGSIQGLGTDSLRILAVDFNNCDTLFVIAMPPVRDPCIFMPNWFSPNGNGKEDLWLIEGFEYGQLKLRIFNVYGQQIYYTESQNYVPWDGTYNGKELPNGDYYYVIESENYFSQYTGYVTILR